MKKLLTFAVVGVAVVSMTSCKKDWNCDCTVSGVTTTSVIPDSNKSDAEEACDALGTAAAIVGGSCELQ